MSKEYVYIHESGEPTTISLRELSKKLMAANVSPPDFASIQDESLRNERLSAFNVFPCEVVKDPIDTDTQIHGDWFISKDVNGKWTKRRTAVEMTAEQKLAVHRRRERERKEAMQRDMRELADPIFMKFQAGEATREEWLAARDLVRSWYADNT
jgi:hypothetical protein